MSTRLPMVSPAQEEPFLTPPPPTRLPLPGLLFSLPFHPLVWGFFLLNLTQEKVTWHLNPLVLELFIVRQGLQ